MLPNDFFNDNNRLIGRRVYMLDGPGQFPSASLASNAGKIVGIGHNQWLGMVAHIDWDNRDKEDVPVKNLRREWMGDKGIGVYLAPSPSCPSNVSGSPDKEE